MSMKRATAPAPALAPIAEPIQVGQAPVPVQLNKTLYQFQLLNMHHQLNLPTPAPTPAPVLSAPAPVKPVSVFGGLTSMSNRVFVFELYEFVMCYVYVC